MIPARYVRFEPTVDSWLVYSANSDRWLFVSVPNFTLPQTFWTFEIDNAIFDKSGNPKGAIKLTRSLQKKGEGWEMSVRMMDVLRETTDDTKKKRREQ